MKKIIILLILLFSNIAYASYPLKTDNNVVKGPGNFELEMGIKGKQGHNRDLYYLIIPEIGIDIGISHWMDIGMSIEYEALFDEDITSKLNMPKFFFQLTPTDIVGFRVDYETNWNNNKHNLSLILLKTIDIKTYILDINLGSTANDIGTDVNFDIIPSLALRSVMPRSAVQLEAEVVYCVNPKFETHLLSFLLAFVIDQNNNNFIVFGLGTDVDIKNSIEWYLTFGIRLGYEK